MGVKEKSSQGGGGGGVCDIAENSETEPPGTKGTGTMRVLTEVIPTALGEYTR